LDAKHVELDDDALEAAAQALEPVHHSDKEDSWETVTSSGKQRRVNSNNVVVVMHSESDSELTKTEDRTFAGAPLAILRRAKKVGEVTTSVCSTLDVARKLDGDLRGSAESDQLLEEWRRDAELHKDSSDDAVRTAAVSKKKRRPVLTPVPATPQTPPSSQKRSPAPSPMFSRRQAEQQLGFAPRPQTRRGPRGRKDSCKAPQQAWAARTASPSSDSDECLDRAEIKRRARRTPCSTKKRRPFASPEELVLVDTPSSETAASPARAVDASPAPVASPALGPRRRRDDAVASPASTPALAPAAGAGTAVAAAAAAAAAPADPREGAANRLADADVVALLAQPPKHVRHLRTRDGFRRFFTGVSRARMAQLLTEAFAGQPPDEAAARREKRLALLADVLAD